MIFSLVPLTKLSMSNLPLSWPHSSRCPWWESWSSSSGLKSNKEEKEPPSTKPNQDMLKRFKLSDAKPASTPMPVKCQLDIDPNGKEVDQKVYHSMIGSLLYLCASRPDIILSVRICARFQPHLRKVTMWRSSESFDIWLIPQTLAYGTQEDQTSSL